MRCKLLLLDAPFMPFALEDPRRGRRDYDRVGKARGIPRVISSRKIAGMPLREEGGRKGEKQGPRQNGARLISGKINNSSNGTTVRPVRENSPSLARTKSSLTLQDRTLL